MAQFQQIVNFSLNHVAPISLVGVVWVRPHLLDSEVFARVPAFVVSMVSIGIAQWGKQSQWRRGSITHSPTPVMHPLDLALHTG